MLLKKVGVTLGVKISVQVNDCQSRDAQHGQSAVTLCFDGDTFGSLHSFVDKICQVVLDGVQVSILIGIQIDGLMMNDFFKISFASRIGRNDTFFCF